MQNTVFEFPRQIGGLLVDDTLFAHAYEAVPDRFRALMKTCIARLYDWYGPRKDCVGRVSVGWRGGFDSIYSYRPVDYTVVLIDAACASPVRLLAGVVPALACGVSNVLVVRVGDGEWRPSLLTALELAGQELTVDMTPDQVCQFFEDICSSTSNGLVVDLTDEGSGVDVHSIASERIGVYAPFFDRTGALWMDDGNSFDLDLLAFAQPDIFFSVHGVECAFPTDNFSHGGEDFQTLLTRTAGVAYVPGPHVDAALEHFRIVLGPGNEGCWVWPDLRPDHFLIHRTAWTLGA